MCTMTDTVATGTKGVNHLNSMVLSDCQLLGGSEAPFEVGGGQRGCKSRLACMNHISQGKRQALG